MQGQQKKPPFVLFAALLLLGACSFWLLRSPTNKTLPSPHQALLKAPSSFKNELDTAQFESHFQKILSLVQKDTFSAYKEAPRPTTKTERVGRQNT